MYECAMSHRHERDPLSSAEQLLIPYVCIHMYTYIFFHSYFTDTNNTVLSSAEQLLVLYCVFFSHPCLTDMKETPCLLQNTFCFYAVYFFSIPDIHKTPFFCRTSSVSMLCIFFLPCLTDTEETALCATEQVLFLYYVVFFQFVGHTGERHELGNGYPTHKCSPLNARLPSPPKNDSSHELYSDMLHELYSNISRPKKTNQITNSIPIYFHERCRLCVLKFSFKLLAHW